MDFTTSVALQVTSAALVVAGFLLFVVAKWLLVSRRGQTLRAYVEENQYDRSLPVGVKFIFGLLLGFRV